MERKIEEVRLITIGPDDIWIYHGRKATPESFKRRNKWKLFAEDFVRLKTERTTVWMRPKGGIGVGCQILEDKKIILCGERPEEMFID